MTIKENRKSIMINRTLIILILTALIANAFVMNHKLDDCASACYEKITGQDAPVLEG